MAEIAPFRGLRYNKEIIPELAEVVIPPYDVISREEQRAFHEKHPYNMIRLELGLATLEDTDKDNPHTRAAAFMQQWEHQRILIRNVQPAIYYYELDYSNDEGGTKTRRGFICALRLEDFASGGVKPHEKTFQAIKDERLSLMLSCNANLSPVFALFSDPESKVQEAFDCAKMNAPDVSFTDYVGMGHRIWMVTDRRLLGQVRESMRDKAIFIADGHHRYETALNYRNALRKTHGSANPNASYEYIMIYLADMNQKGLSILPTHRLLRGLPSWEPLGFIERAQSFFEITKFNAENGGELKWKEAIQTGGERKDTAIGFYCKEAGCVYVLTAKRQTVSDWLEQQGASSPLRTLDVVVLDQLLLRNLLGLSEEFLANERNISFMHDFGAALKAVKSGKFDAGFFINSTRIEQVREVANAGFTMPHKSTYFYPKVTSGLVINPLSPHEEIF